VAVAIEIRIGDSIGMMNIAIPSIIIKMMRQKFDQQWSLRKSAPTEAEQIAGARPDPNGKGGLGGAAFRPQTASLRSHESRSGDILSLNFLRHARSIWY
jgi:hypothetical protein